MCTDRPNDINEYLIYLELDDIELVIQMQIKIPNEQNAIPR